MATPLLLLADLIDAHKAQLGKAADRFRAPDDADFIRHLGLAGRRMDQKRPRLRTTALTLQVGVADYPAPAGSLAVRSHDWGTSFVRQPWADEYIGIPPLIRQMTLDLTTEEGEIVESDPIWRLSTAPTAAQIAQWGAVASVGYRVAHVVSEESITVAEAEQGLLLLAALIEAMRDLSAETAVVQLHKGMTALPTAGTPAYLYERLQQEFSSA